MAEADTNVLYRGLLALALIALIAGLVIHSFIIAVNVNDWWKGRSVTPVDHIVTALGFSRMCTQCALTLYLFLINLSRGSLYSHVTRAIMGALYNSFTYINFWLTALLSIVYCLKISNIQTRPFLYLRRMILQRTGYFIVTLILFSIFTCLTPLSLAIDKLISGRAYNTSLTSLLNDCHNFKSIYIFSIGAFIPLLFYCISSVLFFVLLCHHTTRMKMSSNLTINLETYYSVMKFVSFTFIYNTIYVFAHFFSVFYYYFFCVILRWLYFLMDFLPVLHSSYLIYRTTKFRNQMSKALQNLIDFLFQRKKKESRENIEVIGQ